MKSYQFYFEYGSGVPEIREAPKGAGDTFTAKGLTDRLADLAAAHEALDRLAELFIEAEYGGNAPIGMGAILYGRCERIRARKMCEAMGEIEGSGVAG